MNLSKIAKVILQSQNSNVGTVNIFTIREALTDGEYVEAQQRGWFELREDGCYGLPLRARALEELRTAASAADFKPEVVDYAVTADSFAPYHHFHEAESNPVVGSPVAVVEAGKTYSAVVQGINPDGTYKLSFSGEKPTRDIFSRGELSVPETSATPAAPPAAQQTHAAPVAPGSTTSPMGAGSPVAPGLSARS